MDFLKTDERSATNTKCDPVLKHPIYKSSPFNKRKVLSIDKQRMTMQVKGIQKMLQIATTAEWTNLKDRNLQKRSTFEKKPSGQTVRLKSSKKIANFLQIRGIGETSNRQESLHPEQSSRQLNIPNPGGFSRKPIFQFMKNN